MDRIQIIGGAPLSGTIPVSGAKNAALPLMVSSLLTDGTLTLSNIPHLADIAHLAKILAQHGVEVAMTGTGTGGAADGRVLTLRAATIHNRVAPYELVRKMRASFLVIGPLLARFGEAKVSLPGGCAIGTRPVDLHLKGLEALGAQLDLEEGYVIARTPSGGLTGGHVRFPFASVGATQNILMAATLASGTTVIENAAREPENVDLANCLTAMGARIEGAGTSTITVEGVTSLNGAQHAVMADRIEAGTFAMAVGAAGGEVTLAGAQPELFAAALPALEQAGLSLSAVAGGTRVERAANRARAVTVTTEPYPGFPTDLQAQLMALATTAQGTSIIRETIFENRFMHVPELVRMGAQIAIDGQTATVTGMERLTGAPVMATDLRASVSLILAGLAADGETVVNRVYHLDRGFERIEEKLGACGAQIKRLKD